MRPVGLVRGQHVDLGRVVHRVPEVEARTGLEIARSEAAFEQQHRPAPAERADLLGLGEIEQREASAPSIGEGAGDAVPVGIA